MKIKISKYRNLLYYIGLISGGIIISSQLYLALTSLQKIQISSAFITHTIKSFLFVFLAIFFQILAWFSLMQENQVKINLISTLRGYSLSFLPRYLPGSIWGYLTEVNG